MTDHLGILPQTDHLGISPQEEVMIERQWESLAQSGVQLDVGTPSPVDKMHSVHLYGRGQQMWFQYHDSPSKRVCIGKGHST